MYKNFVNNYAFKNKKNKTGMVYSRKKTQIVTIQLLKCKALVHGHFNSLDYQISLAPLLANYGIYDSRAAVHQVNH